MSDAELSRLQAKVAELEHEVERLRAILAQAGDIIVTTDLMGNIASFNEEAEQVLGYTEDEVLGEPADMFYFHKRERARLLEDLERGGVVRSDVRVRTKDGQRRWLGISLSWLLDAEGERSGTVGVSKDITKRRELEEKLRRLVITDKLTGLYNQSHFYHRLEIEKERAIRLDHELALILFDLDGFKELNDTQGHLKGDEVLRSIGRVLFENIRKEVDSAFRYGGDEFTILLPGADTPMAVAFAQRLRARIESLETGIYASLGICPFDRHNRYQQIVEKADQAMYLAKRQGGNRVAAYDLASDGPTLRTLTEEAG